MYSGMIVSPGTTHQIAHLVIIYTSYYKYVRNVTNLKYGRVTAPLPRNPEVRYFDYISNTKIFINQMR